MISLYIGSLKLCNWFCVYGDLKSNLCLRVFYVLKLKLLEVKSPPLPPYKELCQGKGWLVWSGLYKEQKSLESQTQGRGS